MITELVYEVHVTARDRYEKRTDGTTFSRYVESLAYEELPPAEAVALLRTLAERIEAKLSGNPYGCRWWCTDQRVDPNCPTHGEDGIERTDGTTP